LEVTLIVASVTFFKLSDNSLDLFSEFLDEEINFIFEFFLVFDHLGGGGVCMTGTSVKLMEDAHDEAVSSGSDSLELIMVSSNHGFNSAFQLSFV